MPWSYGYCPYGSDPPQDRSLITRVKRAKHWGFCSDLCTIDSQADFLQETKLTILPIDHCAKFNTSILSYRDHSELCAANKIPYPVMKVYTRKKLRKSRKNAGKSRYVFIHTGNKINTVSSISMLKLVDKYEGFFKKIFFSWEQNRIKPHLDTT